MASESIEIVLGISGADVVTASLDSVAKSLQSINKAVSIQKTVFDLRDLGITATVTKDGVTQLRDSLSGQFVGAVEIATRKAGGLNYALKGIDFAAEDFRGSLGKAEPSMAKLSNSLRTVQHSMLFFGLGTMFMGMQLKRTFEGLLKDTVGTFMKITEAQTETGKGLTILSAGFEYLKFSIGDAIASSIEPFLPMLMNIIEGISEWVSLNPQLAAGIILGGSALGIFMFTIGQLLVFFSSILSLWILLILKFGGLSEAIAFITGVLSKLLLPVGILVGIWTAFNMAISNSGKVFNSVFDAIAYVLDQILGLVVTFPSLIIEILAVLAAAILQGVINALDWIRQYLPDFLKFGIDIIKGILSGIQSMLLLLANAAATVINTIRDKGFLGTLSTFFDAGVQLATSLWNGLMSVLDKLKSIKFNIKWQDVFIAGKKIGSIPVGLDVTIPTLATGGEILESGMAVVHKGEVVLNKNQVNALGSGGFTMGNININITGVPTDSSTEIAEDVSAKVEETIKRTLRAYGITPV